MANSKRNQLIRRSALLNLIFSVSVSSISVVLLRSLFYSYCLLLLLVTLSSANLFNFSWKTAFTVLMTKFKNSNLLAEFYLMLISSVKYIAALSLGVCSFYITAVLFGAYVVEAWSATLYFSCFMTVMTVYPLCLYYSLGDGGTSGLISIFMDCKYESFTEYSVYSVIMCSIVGAWFGAFPIPLDWDRPWQEWPITCCIGAVLGYASAYFYIACMMIWNSYKERRKNLWNIFV